MNSDFPFGSDFQKANEAGCRGLICSDYQAAMKHFTAALSIAKEVQQRHSKIVSPDASSRIKSSSTWYPSNTPTGVFCVDSSPPCNLKKRRANDSQENIDMFSSPMMSGSPALRFSTNCEIDQRIHLAMMIFNLALTVHLQSLHQDLICSPMHRKARLLYQHAWELLDPILGGHAALEKRRTGNATLDALVIAIMNNIAALSFDLGDLKCTEEKLLEILSYVQHGFAPTKGLRRSQSPTERQICMIVSNASLLLVMGMSPLKPSCAASA